MARQFASLSQRSGAPVWSLCFLQLISWGTLYYSVPVLLLPLQRDLGWTQTDILIGTSIALLTQGLVAGPIGRLIDRGHARVVILAGCATSAVSLIGWSVVHEHWQYWLASLAVGVASACTQYEAAFAALKVRSGAAFSKNVAIVTIVGGLASTAFVPLGSLIVQYSGWRTMLQIYALSMVAAGAVVYFLLKDASIDNVLQAIGADESGPGAPSKMVEALLASSFGSFAFMYTVLLVHLLPLLEANGQSESMAVIAYALIGPSQLLGRSVLLLLGQRNSFVMPAATATLSPMAALLLLLLVPANAIAAAIFAVMFGTGMGIKTIVQATAAPRLLGAANYGQLQGRLLIPSFVAQAVAPFASGLLLDAGSYTGLIWVCLVMSVLSASSLLGAIRLARHRNPSPTCS